MTSTKLTNSKVTKAKIDQKQWEQETYLYQSPGITSQDTINEQLHMTRTTNENMAHEERSIWQETKQKIRRQD